MKAISFFCVVFVSMLTAFLIATGEVTRWFSADQEQRQLVFNPPPTSPSTSANTLYFPFYNVELGKLGFTIRAELSQDDLDVKEKFDEIRHLTLRNGSLDIPVYGGLSLGSAGLADPGAAAGKEPSERGAPGTDGESVAGGQKGAARGTPQQITLTFETAEWQRPASKTSTPDGMKVALTNGHGTTNDGFSFHFDELLFLYRSVGAEESYEVSSDRPVTIENPTFELKSPNGLRGKLRHDGIGLESLTFLPPVTAIVDRRRAPFFEYVTTPDATGEGEAERDRTPEEKSEKAKDKDRVERVVITSEGKLELRALPAKGQEARRTVIAFHDNVVIRPEASGDDDDGVQTRFECQYLELAFQEVERRLVPDRALATWEGGRVKAYFEQTGQRSKEGYVVDGDRLEWIYRAPPEGPDGKRAQAVSQAILYGNPTMTGKGSRFQARQALLDLAAGRALLHDVTGRFRIWRRPERRPADDSGGRGSLQALGVDGRREQKRDSAALPEQWDMKADEVEFFFADSAVEGTQKLSHFIARSARPGGVVVDSAPGETPQESADADGIGRLRLTSSHVTYQTAARMITFEGTQGVKPDFSQGENRIESRRIRLLLKKDDELALFEEEVRAHIVDTERLAEVTGSTSAVDPAASDPVESPEKRKDEAHGRGPDGPVELSAELLTAGLDQDGKSISYLRAKGSDGAPARIHSTTGRHFLIEGAELEWNRRDETAIVWGIPPGPVGAEEQRPAQATTSGDPVAAPAPPRRALLEFEGGQLQAESIHFDQKNQTAYLERHVVLEYKDGSETVVEVHTGRAEVELFDDLPAQPPAETGMLRKQLRKVKAFRARRADGSPIELISRYFRAFADDAVWDAETSELRFLGGEKQEIRIENEHFTGPIYAREVVYSVSEDLLTLRGEVQGRLTQHLSRTGKDSGETMEWRFETSRLELQVHASPETGKPELRSMRAREWVHLTSIKEDLALRLLGDALDFDALTGKVTVFSPAGRPQTFFRMDPSEAAASDRRPGSPVPMASGKNRDEIIAQRILLLPVEYPDARFGESKSWLNVVFEKDVKAEFRPPAKTRRGSGPSKTLGRLETGEPWKLDTEKLILRVDPAQAPAGMVTWATAHGGVVFKLGEYTATGNRAEYRDLTQTVILTGDPARLSGPVQNGRPYTHEDERIVILRDGDYIGLQLGRSGSTR